ncbi:SRPBCC family protein [Chachezhania sediminis]|uniref:SRPBCC family protein n=1 Tax=Chachezhania sediminis TaxID=2599291 RepID=UPI00131B68C3|nr:SRPBCC family protein [Chachezhania sediminis]
MEFTGADDIAAPLARVYELLTDFEHFERQAIRRGVDVNRIGAAGDGLQGLAWESRFSLRGRARKVRLDLVRVDPPSLLGFAAVSQGMKATMDIELIALSSSRTRMTVKLGIEARTFSGRLMLQPLRLGQRKAMRRFNRRIQDFARALEERA